MRQRTLLVWLALILLFAVFGLRAIGYLLASILVLLGLFFGGLVLAAWLLKRRMNRRLGELQRAFVQAQQDAAQQRKADASRSNAIDAEFEAGGHDADR
ncbi:MAG: hypothetical protein AABY18_08825 [Candidatus Thermoplasmatota archaeon]